VEVDSTNINEKVVVITGASSGLGEASARYLAARGAAVVLGARRVERLRALVDDITGAGSVTEPDVAEGIGQFYGEYAIPADSFARAVAHAISQPEDVDINEILYRPTRQEL
jgi:NADP-dependent 3-hydroxy acid dehydrogenase YdfG